MATFPSRRGAPRRSSPPRGTHEDGNGDRERERSNCPSIAQEWLGLASTSRPLGATYLGLERARSARRAPAPSARAARARASSGSSATSRRSLPTPSPTRSASRARSSCATLSEGSEAFRHRAWEWDLDQLGGLHITVQDLITVQPLAEPADAERAPRAPRRRPAVFERARRRPARRDRVGPRRARAPRTTACSRSSASSCATPAAKTSFVDGRRAAPEDLAAGRRTRAARAPPRGRRAGRPPRATARSPRLPRDRVRGHARGRRSASGRSPAAPRRTPSRSARTRPRRSSPRPHPRDRQGGARAERGARCSRSRARRATTGDLRALPRRDRHATRASASRRARRSSRATARSARAWTGGSPRSSGASQAPATRCAPLEEYREKDAPAAYYQPPAEDGSRGGHLLREHARPVVVADLRHGDALASTRPCPATTSRSRSRRSPTACPRSAATRGFTAYVEGWAHYTERLADEMGMYSTPYDRLGMLAGAGVARRAPRRRHGHAPLGWTARRRSHVLARDPQRPETDVANEVDRYIDLAGPGARLQDRPAHDRSRLARARAPRLGARFTLARLPRRGAAPRRAARSRSSRTCSLPGIPPPRADFFRLLSLLFLLSALRGHVPSHPARISLRARQMG